MDRMRLDIQQKDWEQNGIENFTLNQIFLCNCLFLCLVYLTIVPSSFYKYNCKFTIIKTE